VTTRTAKHKFVTPKTN